jgi:hypothetical protein
VRKRLVGNLHAEEIAERRPALLYVVDEQAFGRNPAADLGVVAVVRLDGV